jgi:uncharacterized protein YbjT (DUF2867 family)
LNCQIYESAEAHKKEESRMKILVIGGTGTVGSHVVRELLQRKVNLQVLTRNPDKAKSLPVGAEAIHGDLLDPGTVQSVFRGIDGVFLLTAVSTTERRLMVPEYRA